MSKRRRFRIFISAVTGELGSYRQALAKELRRKGLDVCDQEHFRQGGATLLEALRDYIKICDAVIFLIGDRCGAMATLEHATALGDIPGFKVYAAATGQKEASYTQWEFHLAKHCGRKTYTFFTEADFKSDASDKEGDAAQARQQAHRNWIKDQGEHRDTLTTKEKLLIDVLVQDFPSDPSARILNLPYRSIGTLFKGRDAFMGDLRKNLTRALGSTAAAIVNAVHGLGGVGKTRLAVEYAWQRQDDYNALLFVGADSPAKLRSNLAALVGPLVLDLEEQDKKEEEVKVGAALRWLQRNPGWFLILDNIDTREAAEAAEGLLAQLHAGDVLITSRLSRWSKQVEPLELDVLAADDAVAFLLERTDGRRRKTADDEVDARKIATELGELALALEQAGAYIEEQRLSFAQYLAQWQANRDKVTAWFDPQVMQYPKSLAVTWQTSVAQLSEPARRLLDRLAWLAPDPIPESLLDIAVPGDDKTVEDARAALADLERYSLVTRARDEPTFTVHRLVQDVTRRSLKGEPDCPALTQALGWISGAFDGDPADVRDWPALERMAPHAGALAQHANATGIAQPTVWLLNQLGQLLDNKALHVEAERCYRRALTIGENSYGAEHPDVASVLNNLASLLQDTNRLEEAESFFKRALTIGEKTIGPEHPVFATRLSNLAGLLVATNRSTDAEPLIRRALAIDEKSLGPEHPNVATRLNNLGSLLIDTGRITEAEPLIRRALAINEASFGPEHPNVAIDLNNLALLLKATDRLAEAAQYMRRVVSIFEKSFGAEHPHVAAALNNLAALLEDTNRLDEAEPLMRRALAIDENTFGPQHPKVATRLNNLGGLLRATNRLGEAEPLSRRQFAILVRFNRSTGHEHPNFCASRANYTSVLKAMGKSEAEIEAEIEKLMREVTAEVDNQNG